MPYGFPSDHAYAQRSRDVDGNTADRNTADRSPDRGNERGQKRGPNKGPPKGPRGKGPTPSAE